MTRASCDLAFSQIMFKFHMSFTHNFIRFGMQWDIGFKRSDRLQALVKPRSA